MFERRRPIVILSTPRSGSSFIAKTLESKGFVGLPPLFDQSMSASNFNSNGYFEDTWLALLNDQLIRIIWGQHCSFLHVTSERMADSVGDTSFYYDLAPQFVDVPANYANELAHYTGHDWDVWGLTRMAAGGKWHQCYSRAGLADEKGIRNGVDRLNFIFSRAAKERLPLIVKDPRLALTLTSMELETDVIILERESSDVLTSMRNHYGPRLFSPNTYGQHGWVSNHFNYKVPPQSFEQYIENYAHAINGAVQGKNHIRVSLSSLESDGWARLEEFLSVTL